jgi:ParB-like chromosome segregation protein Spo0J
VNLKPHPVAELFPMIPRGSQSWNNLVQSIKEIGQIEPIVIDDGVLIDGRNRLAVCEELKLKPKFVQWSALGIRVDQDEWILAKNIERRNLTDDQRVTIYVQFEELKLVESAKENKAKAARELPRDEGGKLVQQKPVAEATQKSDRNATRNTVAARAQVSTYKAEQALKLNRAVESGKVAPEVREQVKAGIVSLGDALKQVEPVKPSPEPAPPALDEQVRKKFQRFLDGFAVADHKEVKRIVKEMIG